MSTDNYLDAHVRWVEHRGKQILTVHYRGLSEAQMFATLERLASLVRESPTKVRVLVDLENATITSAYLERVKQLGKEVFELKTEKHALLGITGIRMIFVQAYNRITGSGHNQKLFSDRTEALDWLAS